MMRGWDSESDSKLFHGIRSRLVGVLNFDALSKNAPVGTISAHSLRYGGTTTISHACYCLLEVKECGRWKSSWFHGYLRYDMPTMRHFGKRMAVATGILDYAKIKPVTTKAVAFRSGGKKKKSTETQPQSNFPAKCNIPSRDISDASMVDIRKSVHLWRLVPETAALEELRFSIITTQFDMRVKVDYSLEIY